MTGKLQGAREEALDLAITSARNEAILNKKSPDEVHAYVRELLAEVLKYKSGTEERLVLQLAALGAITLVIHNELGTEIANGGA